MWICSSGHSCVRAGQPPEGSGQGTEKSGCVALAAKLSCSAAVGVRPSVTVNTCVAESHVPTTYASAHVPLVTVFPPPTMSQDQPWSSGPSHSGGVAAIIH